MLYKYTYIYYYTIEYDDDGDKDTDDRPNFNLETILTTSNDLMKYSYREGCSNFGASIVFTLALYAVQRYLFLL